MVLADESITDMLLARLARMGANNAMMSGRICKIVAKPPMKDEVQLTPFDFRKSSL